MRKKTIEEELKEIAAEKEEHIENLHQEYMTSKDDHAYDFDNCDRKETRYQYKTESSNNVISSEDEFTVEDRKELDKFHNGERDIHDDAEWDEYMRLCEKYNKAVKNDTLWKSMPNAHINTNRQIKTKPATLKSSLGAALFLCIFVVAGLCVMIFPGILPLMRVSNIEYVEVQCEVRSISVHSDNGKYYATMGVDFEYADTAYHTFVKMDVTNTSIPQIGDKLMIKINPNDPMNIKHIDYSSYIIPIVFGVFFTGFALFMQIALIVQAVKHRK